MKQYLFLIAMGALMACDKEPIEESQEMNKSGNTEEQATDIFTNEDTGNSIINIEIDENLIAQEDTIYFRF